MEIEINKSRKISEIQEEFNQKFPYLSLQFFHSEIDGKQVYTNDNKIKFIDKQLSEFYSLQNVGLLNINGHVKVDTLEMQLMDEFQIPTQLYRKSGNVWLQTIETNHWTLSEQNRHGEEMERDLSDSNEPKDFDQFREQR